MIDAEMVELTDRAKAQLASMRNARPSEKAAVREKLGDDLLALLGRALDGITPEQKIAAFDRLAETHVQELVDEVKARMAGEHGEDSATEHYTWEAVREAVLGPNAFEATNRLSSLLGG